MSYALLWFEGPLQAWGADSRFGRRSTLRFPTRSGILGLVCCALGRGGAQEDWLSKWHSSTLEITAYSIAKAQSPLLRDFHMVGSGYNPKDPWQDLLIPKKSDGGRPVGGGSKLTYRYYIQDMAFACILEIPDNFLEEVSAGLLAPVWAICLGRKNCIPADIVFRGIFNSALAAINAGEEIARSKNMTEKFRVVEGYKPEIGQCMVLNDVPLAFGTQKKYRDRYVTVINPGMSDEYDMEEVSMFDSVDDEFGKTSSL